MNDTPVTDLELHAYVDDELDAAARARVERHLAEHPHDAARVRDWAAQRAALRERFGRLPQEPLPAGWWPAMQAASPVRWWQQRWAAVLLAGVVGLAGGWGAREAWSARTPAALAALPRQAAVAHVVYAPDARRPVEVAQLEPLVAWLSKRMGVGVHAPDLTPDGFELIGGRLLPGRARPVAQFMYQDAGGRRLTLYLTTELPTGTEAGFRFAEEAGVQVMYWVDGAFGYALSSGSLDRAALARLAQTVHRQAAPS